MPPHPQLKCRSLGSAHVNLGPAILLGSISGEPLRSFAYKATPSVPAPSNCAVRSLDSGSLISRNGQLRAFGGVDTHATEAGADTACTDFGCRIIDGTVRMHVADLR
jgi:hypothetical protein